MEGRSEGGNEGGSGVARGHGGYGPPKLLRNKWNVFPPINLRCYVILVCK